MARKQTLSHYKYTNKINSFFLKHAAKLMKRSERTLRRWVKSGRIRARQSSSRWWFIQLDAINEVRVDDGLPKLTKEEAIAMLVDAYPEEEI